MASKQINDLVILINGKAGVGKDTFVSYCEEYCKEHYPHLSFKNLHRSDKPKEALKFLGWDGTKNSEARSLLVKLTSFAEEFGLTSKYLRNNLSSPLGDNSGLRSVIFYHIRDPKSIASLQSEFNDVNLMVLSLIIERNTEDIEQDVWGIYDYEYNMGVSAESLNGSKSAAQELMSLLISEINGMNGGE